MQAFITQMLNYGAAPALLVLAASVGFLIKKIDDNGKKDDERASQIKAYFAEQFEGLERRIEDRLSTIDRRIEDLAGRVSCVERDYLPREEHYKEFSGWRAEIHRMSDLIISLFKEKK